GRREDARPHDEARARPRRARPASRGPPAGRLLATRARRRPHGQGPRGRDARVPPPLRPRPDQAHVERRVLRRGLGLQGRLHGVAERRQAVHGARGDGAPGLGADGLFVATQTASAEVLSADALDTLELPATRRLVEAVAGATPLVMLHAHGREIAFDRLAALPVHALNWHDRLTPPALGEAQRRFAGAVVGGLGEAGTLRRGPAAAIAEEVGDALRQTGGRGLIVAPGCVLPLDVPEAHLDAVIDAVKRSHP